MKYIIIICNLLRIIILTVSMNMAETVTHKVTIIFVAIVWGVYGIIDEHFN